MSSRLRSRVNGVPFAVCCLCVTTVISRGGTTALVFLVMYLVALGSTETQAGFAISAYGVGGLLATPVTGYVCDRVGPLSAIKVVLFLQGLILLLIPLGTNINYVLCLIVFWSLTGEAFRPASSAFIASLPDERWRGIAFAANRIATNVGMSIGAAAGGVLIQIRPASMFVVNGVASIVAGAFLTYSFPRKACEDVLPPIHVTQCEHRQTFLKVARLIPFFIALIPAFCVFYQYRSTMVQYFVSRNILEPYLLGLLMSINAVLAMIFQIPLTLYLQKGRERISMSLGAFLIGTGFGAFIFSTTFWEAAFCVVVWTLGQVALLSGSEIYVSKIADGLEKGRYLGLYHMAINVAAFIGPGIGLFILGQSAALLWGIMFTFGILSAVALLRLADSSVRQRP